MNCSSITLSYSNPNNTDWISIVMLFISFCALGVSIKALNVWKDEIREKRRYELTKELYFVIEKFEYFYNQNIKNINNIDNEKILLEFKNFNTKLHTILLEYSYLKTPDNIQKLISFFIKFVNENSDDFYNIDIDDDGIITGAFHFEQYSDKNFQADMEKKISALKNFCKTVIKEFYLGKDKSRLMKRYSAEMYFKYQKDKK